MENVRFRFSSTLNRFAFVILLFAISSTSLRPVDSAPIPLTNGDTIHGFVDNGLYQFFSLNVPQVTQDQVLFVNLTSLSGDPNLYASKPTSLNPTPAMPWYDFSSAQTGSDFLRLKNLTFGNYYFGVYGNTASKFSLSASLVSLPFLPDSMQVNGLTDQYGYSFFLFNVTVPCAMLSASLTSDPGTSFTAYFNFPIAVLLASTSSNSIALASNSEPMFRSCQPVGIYSVTVVGPSSGPFRLFMNHRSANAIELSDQSVVLGQVQQYDFVYFLFNATNPIPLWTVNLTCLNGTDSNLYIGRGIWPSKTYSNYVSVNVGSDSSTFRTQTPGVYYIGVTGVTPGKSTFLISVTVDPTTTLDSQRTSGGLPDTSTYRFHWFNVQSSKSLIKACADATSGTNFAFYKVLPTAFTFVVSVSVASSDCFVVGEQAPGPYVFMVYLYNGASGFYNITAAEQPIIYTTLNESVTLSGQVEQSNHIFYTFTTPYPTPMLKFELVVLNATDANLYITPGATSTSPTKWNFGSSSTAVGSDYFTINNPTFGTPYKVGVNGQSVGITNYNITARIGLPVVQSGVPYELNLTLGQYYYTNFTLTTPYRSVKINVSLGTGAVIVYFTKPTATGYSNLLNNYFTTSGVVFVTNQTAGTYWIGCLGNSAASASFNITITESNPSNIYLTDGVPQFGVVAKEDYSFFAFSVLSAIPSLTINLGVITGEANLYASKTTFVPTKYSYSYSSTLTGNDTMSLHFPSVGIYYISVIGGADSSKFVISATCGNSVLLGNSSTVTGQVEQAKYAYFSFNSVLSSSIIFVSLNPIASDADFYMSKPLPTGYLSNYVSNNVGPEFLTVASQTPGVFMVAVFGKASQAASFFLTAYEVPFQGHTPLVDNVTLSGQVQPLMYNYYSFNVTEPAYVVMIQVSCTKTNDVNVYVSKPPNAAITPSKSSYSSGSSTAGSDVVVLKLAAPGMHYVAVYGVSNISSYNISLMIEHAIPLQPGVSFLSQAFYLTFTYFSFPVKYSGSRVTISVKDLNGADPNLYVTDSSFSALPTITSYKYCSTNYGDDTVVFTSASPGKIWIGVYGKAGNPVFNVMASEDIPLYWTKAHFPSALTTNAFSATKVFGCFDPRETYSCSLQNSDGLTVGVSNVNMVTRSWMLCSDWTIDPSFSGTNSLLNLSVLDSGNIEVRFTGTARGAVLNVQSVINTLSIKN